MKGNSIKKSVWIRILIILIAISLSAVTTIFGLWGIQKATERKAAAMNLYTIALNSEKAHYVWVESLGSALSFDTPFDGELNYKACDLGHWLYSNNPDDVSSDPKIQKLMEEIKPIHQRIHESAEEILTLKKISPAQAQDLYLNQTKPDVIDLTKKLDAVIAQMYQFVETEQQALMQRILLTLFSMIACLLLVLAACFLLMRYIIPKVVNPLTIITHHAQQLAEGDLQFQIDIGVNQNEVGLLADTLNGAVTELRSYVQAINLGINKMIDGDLTVGATIQFKGQFEKIQTSILKFEHFVNETLKQFRQTAKALSSASEQVSAGAQFVAQGAVEQTSAIEELARTISQISDQGKSNLQNALQAQEKVDTVGEEMQRSNEKMQELTSAISDINHRSHEIEAIIKTIDNIAFQTNILALNAAVEAARAGNSGKGFGVVADEVRNLACESSKAAKDIKDLIQETVASVENGTQITVEAADLLTNAVNGANNVIGSVNSIFRASEEQLVSIEQINAGIEQISSVVQANSASAQESAATSEELSDQARQMKRLLEQYILEE